MDIVVVSKKDNLLLGRTEVRFRIVHTKEKTPDRDTVRDKLAAILNERKETVIVDSMNAQFGKPESLGYAKVYRSREQAMKVERDRTLVRNKLKERKAKAKAEKAPKKEAEAPKAEEKPAAKTPTPKVEEKPAAKTPAPKVEEKAAAPAGAGPAKEAHPKPDKK